MIHAVEIPTRTLPDGRQFIADRTTKELPEVLAFVRRLNNYWRYDINMQGWVST